MDIEIDREIQRNIEKESYRDRKGEDSMIIKYEMEKDKDR